MKREWLITCLLIVIAIITFAIMFYVLQLPRHQTCKCDSCVTENITKINELLLEKYIFEHSKYSYNDPNIRRIIENVKIIVDKYYPRLIHINTVLTKYELKLLTYALIEVESKFDIYSRSRSGAVGLMQILPNSANLNYIRKYLDITTPQELFDIQNNITAGLILLNHHFEIAKKKLKDKRDITRVNVIKKALNIYSNDNSGRYAIKVLTIMTRLKYILKVD